MKGIVMYPTELLTLDGQVNRLRLLLARTRKPETHSLARVMIQLERVCTKHRLSPLYIPSLLPYQLPAETGYCLLCRRITGKGTMHRRTISTSNQATFLPQSSSTHHRDVAHGNPSSLMRKETSDSPPPHHHDLPPPLKMHVYHLLESPRIPQHLPHRPQPKAPPCAHSPPHWLPWRLLRHQTRIQTDTLSARRMLHWMFQACEVMGMKMARNSHVQDWVAGAGISQAQFLIQQNE